MQGLGILSGKIYVKLYGFSIKVTINFINAYRLPVQFVMMKQMINHGALEEIEKMKVVTEEFFKLPLEEKMVCAQLPHSIEGYGQAFVHSDDQKLDWADMLFLLPRPYSNRNIEIWPKSPSSFRYP